MLIVGIAVVAVLVFGFFWRRNRTAQPATKWFLEWRAESPIRTHTSEKERHVGPLAASFDHRRVPAERCRTRDGGRGRWRSPAAVNAAAAG